MKILFVVFNDYLASNGISVVTQYLAEGLAQRQHDVTVFTAVRQTKKPDSHNGVRIEAFNVSYNRFKQPKGETTKLRQRIIEENSDVVIYVSLQTPTTDCALEIFDSINAKKILHTHDFEGLYLRPVKWKGDIYHSIGNTWNYLIWNRYYSGFVRRNINKFDLIISLSKCNKDVQYLDKYCYKDKIVIGNAAEDMFYKEDCSFERAIEEKYFVSVANYNHVKNQVFILSEYYKTEASRTHAMVFCGSTNNAYVDRLLRLKKRLDAKYGFRKVFFLTGLARERIPGLVKNATLYLCGSRWEAYSISLIEAMAVGTPFLSVDVGNARELPGGMTISRRCRFSSALDELMNNEEMRSGYSLAGMKYSRDNCRIEKAVDAFEMALNNLFD